MKKKKEKKQCRITVWQNTIYLKFAKFNIFTNLGKINKFLKKYHYQWKDKSI